MTGRTSARTIARFCCIVLWLMTFLACAPIAAQSTPAKGPPPASIPEPPPIQQPSVSLPDASLPFLIAPPPPSASGPPVFRGLSSAQEVIRAILGLVVLLGLASLGGHPR